MGFFSTVKQKMSSGKGVENKSGVISNDTTNENEVTLTEVGKPDNAEHCLIMASEDSSFSESAIEYALDMAKRMDYRLIALNAIELEHPAINALSASTKHICQDLECVAKKNIESVYARAEEKGLKFTHMVHFNGVDQAIEEIRKKYANIDFVVSATQEEEELHNRHHKENRVEQRLCVYSMN